MYSCGQTHLYSGINNDYYLLLFEISTDLTGFSQILHNPLNKYYN